MASFFIAGPLVVFFDICGATLAAAALPQQTQNGKRSVAGRFRCAAVAVTKAKGLEARIDTLERILDAESPNWRRNYE